MSPRLPAIGRPSRRAVTAAATLALVALASWGAMHAVKPGALRETFATVSWPWVVAAAIAYAVGQIASGLVWGVGLRAGGVGVGRRHVMSAHWLGHGAGEILPAQLGHVVRFAAIRRHPAARREGCLRVAGSMGAHRAVDSLVTFVVMALAVMVIPLPAGAGVLRWVAGVTLAGLVLALVAAWRLGPGRAERLVPRRLRGPVADLARGAALFSRREHVVAAVALQLVAVGGRVVSLAALLQAFHMPPGAALLVFALIVLSGLLAISPGGVGVREAALVPALVATYGLGAQSAIAFSLGIQATALVVSLMGAAVALLSDRLWPPHAAGAPAPSLA
ncbi:MAG: YbhN family protein [Thermoleophilia bacterium]